MQVITDFNETLVHERTLPIWCRRRIRHGTVASRLGAALKCGLCGPSALAVDLLGFEVLAARIGLAVFRGEPVAELEAFARSALAPNRRAFDVLARLARESGPLELTVISRGSPTVIVRAFLDGPTAAQYFRSIPLATPVQIVAPRLELVDGRCTGRLLTPPGVKADRPNLLVAGGVFLGDRRDERWAHRALAEHDVTFISI